MSFPSCACSVVVLNQQQEQNISHKNQYQDVPVNSSKSEAKSSTVVENGRVVVKPIQTLDETSNTQKESQT
ncbi:hypothetical protein I8748_31765 [Nostoc sp. CENA67]|uniref:Uncharacterized protein n=2 Tax=Amazonocrinis TaxID=2840440 RepID=A0A8J7LBF6_9NOST|nr:hypothetical protein [Amazonocrinis nigriterrae CENA67]